MRTLHRLLKDSATALILLLFAMAPLGNTAAAGDYVTNYKRTPAVQNLPSQVARWDKDPTIIVCEYAPVSEIQVNSAIAFWEHLGHKILYSRDTSNTKISTPCNQKKPAGFITVHLVTVGISLPPTSLAETHFYVDNTTNQIEWATIYLRSGVKKTVLEHEVGHALGFLHFNKINHLMNEMWEMGGWDSDGLEKKR